MFKKKFNKGGRVGSTKRLNGKIMPGKLTIQLKSENCI